MTQSPSVRLVTEAALATDLAGLSASYAGQLHLSDLAVPYTIVHNGTSDVIVGHTPEAYRYAWMGGMRILDLDARLLADGTLANIHDATVDNMTTATGNVSAYTALDFPNLVVDVAPQLGNASGYPNSTPTLIADLIRQYGVQALYAIEAKDGLTSTVQKIVDLATSLGVKRQVIAQSVNLSSLAPAVSAGMLSLQITDTPNVAAVQAAGVTGVIFSTAASNANISAAVAGGLLVWVYGVSRRYDHDAYVALGVKGVMSNNPLYTARVTPTLTADLFIRKTWLPGLVLDVNDRGGFLGTNRHGWSTAGVNAAVLDGWMSPVTATTYTITSTITFDTVGGSASAYAYMHVCAPDDRANKNNIGGGGLADGYRVQVQQNGTLAMFKTRRSDSSETPIGTNKGFTAPIAGGTVTLTVQVTPTQIIATAGGQTDTATDSEFRGGYVHRGQNGLASSLTTSWSGISVA